MFFTAALRMSDSEEEKVKLAIDQATLPEAATNPSAKSTKTPRTPPQAAKSWLGKINEPVSSSPGGTKRGRKDFKGSSSSESTTPSPQKHHKPLGQGEEGVKLVIVSEDELPAGDGIEMAELTMEEKMDKLLKITSGTDAKVNLVLGVRPIVNRLETESKKKNVIVLGLEEVRQKFEDKEDHQIAIEGLCQIMKLERPVDWDDCYRLGRFQPGKTRPLLIRFVRTRDQMEFMKMRSILKGTRIKLKDDETQEQREARKLFGPVYENEWLLDNTVRRFIKNGKMMIFKGGLAYKAYEVRGGKVVIVGSTKLPEKLPEKI